MIGKMLFGILFAAAVVGGFGLGSGKIGPSGNQNGLLVKSANPQREMAVTEYKSFAVILYAHNDAAWCERALHSLFEQDYDYFRLIVIDDGSSDHTYEKVEAFLAENRQTQKAVLMRLDQPVGKVAALYQAMELCLDKEIVFPLAARDWFAVPTVLSRLNRAFQNPDVWMAFGQSIAYPSYEISDAPERNSESIEKSGYGMEFLTAPVCFYSALFKQIPLEHLSASGTFSKEASSYLLPMLEMSGGRFRSLQEPFHFANLTLPQSAPRIEKRRSQAPLAHFPQTVQSAPKTDILFFSYDRPLQLYAALESTERFVRGYETLSVLYRTSDERFEEGYRQLRERFPFVCFIKQGEDARADFKPQVLETLFSSPSDYILFCVDDSIFKEEVDLSVCARSMERTKAYAFLLCLGRNIQYTYEEGMARDAKGSFKPGSGLWALDFSMKDGRWNGAANLDMALYRKADLRQVFESERFKSPDSLLKIWAKHAPKQAIGLYFDRSKAINIPLMSSEELLVKFHQNLKIDIDPFYQAENLLPQHEGIPEFVLR